jgi:hypothetical protein
MDWMSVKLPDNFQIHSIHAFMDVPVSYYATERSVNGRSMNRYYGTSKSSTIWLPNQK